MMNSDPAVRTEDLAVVRGGRTVLDGLTFTVPRGQVTGLLGPSGCGKSTLMRALVGVQAQVSGLVEVLGRPAGSPAVRHRVGYVTQAPSVYPDLTVRENLLYFAAVLAPKAGRAAHRESVEQAVREVDLGDHADSLVGNLSGGQHSRASLAVALLRGRDGHRPELLVLDEPTVGLDPVLRRDLWSLFHRIADEGAAVLVSSHVMDEAERCERLLLLRAGRLLADSTPDRLRRDTGAKSVEDAFLHLVGEAARATAEGGKAPAGAARIATARGGAAQPTAPASTSADPPSGGPPSARSGPPASASEGSGSTTPAGTTPAGARQAGTPAAGQENAR